MVWVAEGGDKVDFLNTLPLSLALPRTKMVDLGAGFLGTSRTKREKFENFGSQGLESGRADIKILVLCASIYQARILGLCICHSPCLSVGRCIRPRGKE